MLPYLCYYFVLFGLSCTIHVQLLYHVQWYFRPRISAFVIIGMCRQSLAVTNINAEHNFTSQDSTVQHMHFMSQRISLLIFVVGIDGIWNSSTYDTVFRCHLRQSNLEFGICPSTISVLSWMECGICTTTLSLDIRNFEA